MLTMAHICVIIIKTHICVIILALERTIFGGLVMIERKYAYLARTESKTFPICAIKVFDAASDSAAMAGVIDYVEEVHRAILGIIVWNLDDNIMLGEWKV